MSVNNHNLEKDIFMICKGWYDKDKYTTVLDAFNAYYHAHYRHMEINMDFELALKLFLKPTVEYYLELNPDKIMNFFES